MDRRTTRARVRRQTAEQKRKAAREADATTYFEDGWATVRYDGKYQAEQFYADEDAAVEAAKTLTRSLLEDAAYIASGYAVVFAVPVKGRYPRKKSLYPALEGEADGRILVLFESAEARDRALADDNREDRLVAAGGPIEAAPSLEVALG